ncbi:MAG: hypothetical protein Q8S18_08075 [Bacteroidales bacterium]|nr:hypothetical protein [Bacteroidales bacterium]
MKQVDDNFFSHSFQSGGLKFITPLKAYPLCLQGTLLIDLRPDYEGAFKRPDVPELMLIPYTEIDEHLSEIPLERDIILADCVGIRSKEVMILLHTKGYTRLLSLAGGFVDWERDGLPIKVDLSERLTGSCMCQLKPRENKKQ